MTKKPTITWVDGECKELGIEMPSIEFYLYIKKLNYTYILFCQSVDAKRLILTGVSDPILVTPKYIKDEYGEKVNYDTNEIEYLLTMDGNNFQTTVYKLNKKTGDYYSLIDPTTTLFQVLNQHHN